MQSSGRTINTKQILRTKPTSTKKAGGYKTKVNSKAKISLRRLGNVENFVVAWLDSNIDQSNGGFRNSNAQLGRILNSIEIFIEINAVLKRI